MSDCIFCKIAAGEIPAKIVDRTDEWVVFRDVAPQAPVHLLVIPVRHVVSLHDMTPEDEAMLGRLLLAARNAAESEGLASGGGYRVVTNVGRHAGQSVFHLHVHVLGGRPMGWPPG